MTITKILKWSHILFGSIVLILGLAQMILPKKGEVHRGIGKAYFILMILVFLTSFPQAILSHNWFLASVELFALYLVLSSYCFSTKKTNLRANIWDKLICFLWIFSGIFLIRLTIYFFIDGANGFAFVSGIFGLMLLLNAFTDFKFPFMNAGLGQYGKMRWFFNHLSRMITSYIVAKTAFLLNVQRFGSNVINWIFPTIVGTIFIITLSRFYEKKFTTTAGKVSRPI